MSLTKQQADYIAETLRGEFNAVAEFQSTSSLNGGPKVVVYAEAKTPDSTLKQISARAEQLAGYKMDSSDFEFKSGLKHGR